MTPVAWALRGLYSNILVKLFIIALLKYSNDGFEANDNLLRRGLLYCVLSIGKYRQLDGSMSYRDPEARIARGQYNHINPDFWGM